MATRNSLCVAAIDFGTTYSGFAFSFKHEFDTDPTKISTMKWSGSKLISLKGPTCVLIQPDGKTLDKFGFEAESKYSELSQNGDHKKWFYFQRFKMLLWDKPIHKDTMLDDECGKSLQARTVFSLSIRFMMDRLLSMSQQQVTGLDAGDIHWVLTVPAIWDDSAKQFMRLAAQEAGISSEKISIALESEAASIYCRYLPVRKDGKSASFRLGKKYLVLDAGGDTIDISVHEVCVSGAVTELYKATGGAWGGTAVDQVFVDFMGELIGKDILELFKNKHMEDYLDLLRDFEVKKRETHSISKEKVTMKLPVVIFDLLEANKGQTLKKIIHESVHASKIDLIRDKLRLDHDIFRSFFKGSVDKIVQHLSSVLRKPETSGVETILMVGGYSESPLLQEAVKNEFPTIEIIVPQDADEAVLKGAVIFGHCSTSSIGRVSKYTKAYDRLDNATSCEEKLPNEDGVCEGGASSGPTYHGNYKKQYDDCLTFDMITSYGVKMKSVGAIIFRDKIIGTGFRVGTNCIATARHVITRIIDPGEMDNWNLGYLSEAYIDFNDFPSSSTARKFYFRKDILYHDGLLDVAVVEIANDCNLLPEKLSLSTQMVPAYGDKTVAVIGYGHKNEGKYIEQCPVIHSDASIIQKAMMNLKNNEKELKVGLSPSKPFSVVEKGYKDYDLPHKLIVNTYMEDGGSGSPMIACLNYGAKLEVVGVFTHAMPECYFCIEKDYKRLIPPEYRFEAGARMTHIYNDMKRRHFNEVIQDLFN